jgi:hypothetical protein
MDQAVSGQPFTMEAQVWSQGPSMLRCGGGGSWHWNRFFSNYVSFPIKIIPPMLHTHLHLSAAISRMISEWGLGTLKELPFQLWRKKYFHTTSLFVLQRINVNKCIFKTYWNCCDGSINYTHFKYSPIIDDFVKQLLLLSSTNSLTSNICSLHETHNISNTLGSQGSNWRDNHFMR